MKNKFLSFAVALNFVVSPLIFADSVDIYFGPKGGFSHKNNSRTLNYSNGDIKKATLANSLTHCIDQLEPGSTVKIAMYSMSDWDSLNYLLDAAREKGIKFRLLMDGVSSWSASSRDKIAKAIKKAAARAKEEGKDFSFKLAAVSQAAMKRNDRDFTLEDGKIIYGTMHEKFGVIYSPRNPIPHSCFNGSANISTTSDQVYGENRVFFINKPAVARQFAEEFARLWNEYSEMFVGEWVPEKYIEADHVPGYAKIIFNSEPVNELELTRIDSELINLISRVNATGSLDLAMFSFTRIELSDAILRAAKRNPEARFRLLLDHAQLDDSVPEQSKLAPSIEKRAKELELKNIQIRYRFRHNAYAYSKKDKQPMLLSYLSLFLHHKNVTVNNREIAIGSYNWSNSAEFVNFENVMFFNAFNKGHQKIIDCFKAEFEVLWNSRIPLVYDKPRKGEPQTVTLAEGKALHKKLLKLLSKKENNRVLATLDREAFKTFEQIKKETKLGNSKISRALKALIKANMVVKWINNDKEGYSQAD